jgi:hypothetical protein
VEQTPALSRQCRLRNKTRQDHRMGDSSKGNYPRTNPPSIGITAPVT